MKTLLGSTLRAPRGLRNFCAMRVVRRFSWTVRSVGWACVLLAATAGPALASPRQALVDAIREDRLVAAPAQSAMERAQRELNRYRLDQWRRLARESGDRKEREHALSCAQAIGSDIGYWKAEEDPECELPWMLGERP